MSSIAARHAAEVVEASETVVAIELLLVAQAIDLRGAGPAPALEVVRARLRDVVPFMAADRVVANDIEAVRGLVHSGVLA